MRCWPTSHKFNAHYVDAFLSRMANAASYAAHYPWINVTPIRRHEWIQTAAAGRIGMLFGPDQFRELARAELKKLSTNPMKVATQAITATIMNA